jgi:hypothetical protein
MDDANKLQLGFDEYIGNALVDKKLHSGHLQYTVNNLQTVLSNFQKSPEGATAKVMLILPDGRNPMQKEFNIREIRLVENKMIGAVSSDPRSTVPDTLSRGRDPGACCLRLVA